MKIKVQVKPNSKKEAIEILAENTYLVRVNRPPTEGKANERVIELLSEYLDIPKSKFEMISGAKSKTKVFKVNI